jgi:hypothetical protein
MRGHALYILTAILVLECWQVMYPQDEPDTAPLIKKWLNGETQSGIISLKTLKRWKKGDDASILASVNMTFLDLNGDRKKELVIQSDCAPVGNCSLEIHQKTGKTYKTLLATDMVQTIKVLKAKANGYYNLKLGTHGSAFESYYRVFRFSGKEYKKKKCWTESYETIDKNGKWHQLKKPKIKYGCSEDY